MNNKFQTKDCFISSVYHLLNKENLNVNSLKYDAFRVKFAYNISSLLKLLVDYDSVSNTQMLLVRYGLACKRIDKSVFLEETSKALKKGLTTLIIKDDRVDAFINSIDQINNDIILVEMTAMKKHKVSMDYFDNQSFITLEELDMRVLCREIARAPVVGFSPYDISINLFEHYKKYLHFDVLGIQTKEDLMQLENRMILLDLFYLPYSEFYGKSHHLRYVVVNNVQNWRLHMTDTLDEVSDWFEWSYFRQAYVKEGSCTWQLRDAISSNNIINFEPMSELSLLIDFIQSLEYTLPLDKNEFKERIEYIYKQIGDIDKIKLDIIACCRCDFPNCDLLEFEQVTEKANQAWVNLKVKLTRFMLSQRSSHIETMVQVGQDIITLERKWFEILRTILSEKETYCVEDITG